jgi:hypothetical protein
MKFKLVFALFPLLLLGMRIPTKSATDSERMRPPLGAERRKLSKVTQSWPTSGFFASRLRIDSPFKVIL